MSMAYIRDHYGVPARRGARVVFDPGGAHRPGTITGARGAHLLIKFDDEKGDGPAKRVQYHPTWKMHYLVHGWGALRPKPMTNAQVRRLPCIRCGARAHCQWQICADGNNWRPLCQDCDVALNRAVLEFMNHPDPGGAVLRYTAPERGERGEGDA